VIRRVALFALGLLVASSCSWPWTSNVDQGSKIQELAIASDLPLSGALGVGVRPLRDAIALAIHDRGTVGGYRLTYLSFDDSLIGTFDDAKAEQNVKLMVGDSRVVALIGPFSSGAARIAIALGGQTNLAMISPSNTADCLTSDSNPCVNHPTPNNYFRIGATDSAQANATARFAAQTLNVTRFAVLDDGSEYGTNLADAFASTLVAIGGSVALRRSFSATAGDYTGLLHDALVAKAEAVYVGGPAPAGVCRMRAAMASVFPANTYMLGGDGLAGPSCIFDAGVGANDHLLAMVSDSQPRTDSKVYTEFRAHNIAAVPYAFAAYDSAQIIINSIERAIKASGGRVPTRRAVLDSIAATRDFAGATGSYTFLPTGDATTPAASVYRVERGQWTFWQNAPSLPKTIAATPLDGGWEVNFTRAELLARTTDPGEDSPGNYGHLTLEFNGGDFRLTAPDGSVGAGTYVVTGNLITFYRTDAGGPGEIWTYTWSIHRNALTFAKGGPGLHPTPFIVKPWSRVST
jgi:branched-chain amino acid transport system substrate-binding protein